MVSPACVTPSPMMRAGHGGTFCCQHFHIVAKVLKTFLAVIVAAFVAQLKQNTLHGACFSLQTSMSPIVFAVQMLYQLNNFIIAHVNLRRISYNGCINQPRE